ncbi:MAG: histidine kinase dimerization/phosphoacceptor domain -containing protein [bacterium]
MSRSVPRHSTAVQHRLRRGVGLIVAHGAAIVVIVNAIRFASAEGLGVLGILISPYVAPLLAAAVLAALSAAMSGRVWFVVQVALFVFNGLAAAYDASPGSLTGYTMLLFGLFLAFEYDLLSAPALTIVGATLAYIALTFVGMYVANGYPLLGVVNTSAATVFFALLAWFVLASRMGEMRSRARELQREVLDQTRELRRRYTESERLRESLDSSLKGQQELLAEIHHRTKNNLQLVSALIGLNEADIEHAVDTRQAKRAQVRIKALAVLHDRLYANLDAARVELATLFPDYASQLSGLGRGWLDIECSVTGNARGDIEPTIRVCLALNEVLFALANAADAADAPLAVALEIDLTVPSRVSIRLGCPEAAAIEPNLRRERIVLAGQILARIGGELTEDGSCHWGVEAPIVEPGGVGEVAGYPPS